MKRLKLGIGLVIVIVLGLWVASRWHTWFVEEDEVAYVASSSPVHVLLTFGDAQPLSRNVSWQADSIVRPSWLELVCLADSDTIRVEAQGEVFRSRGGQAAYYVARLRELQAGTSYAYRAVTGAKASPWYQFRKNCWEEAFRDIDSVTQAMPLLVVAGNHDYRKGVIQWLERRFPLTFSYFLDSKMGDNQVYTLNYGPVQFFLLDSNRELPYLLTQRDWLKAQLEQSRARWKIVVLHHPLFSIRSRCRNLIQRWVFNDLLETYDVDLVLQAHEHAYARMTAHESGQAVTPVYTVSHCSPKNYDIYENDRYDKSIASSRFYQTVRISGDTLTLAAYEVYHHSLCDSLQIIKEKDITKIIE